MIFQEVAQHNEVIPWYTKMNFVVKLDIAYERMHGLDIQIIYTTFIQEV